MLVQTKLNFIKKTIMLVQTKLNFDGNNFLGGNMQPQSCIPMVRSLRVNDLTISMQPSCTLTALQPGAYCTSTSYTQKIGLKGYTFFLHKKVQSLLLMKIKKVLQCIVPSYHNQMCNHIIVSNCLEG